MKEVLESLILVTRSSFYKAIIEDLHSINIQAHTRTQSLLTPGILDLFYLHSSHLFTQYIKHDEDNLYPWLQARFSIGLSRTAENCSGSFGGAVAAGFGPWIRGFPRIGHSAEASWTFFILESNVQLWRSLHFWCWSSRKSSTNRASDYLLCWVLDPMVDFMTPYTEDIITNMNSQMTKQHTHYETAKIFLHLSQLPVLNFVLKLN